MNPFAAFDRESDESSEADTARWVENREANYEQSLVKQVLKFFNLEERAREISEAGERATGDRRLTFAWFHNIFTGFPVRLCSRHLPDCSKDLMADAHNSSIKEGKLRDKFFSNLLFRKYSDALEEFGAGDTVAMMFPCRGIPHYVLHNGEADLTKPGSRLCKTGLKGNVYLIEPLGQYLSNLGWSP